MPYDDWNEALIDRGWEQMKQLLDEQEPPRAFVPGWWMLLLGALLFLVATRSERFSGKPAPVLAVRVPALPAAPQDEAGGQSDSAALPALAEKKKSFRSEELPGKSAPFREKSRELKAVSKLNSADLRPISSLGQRPPLAETPALTGLVPQPLKRDVENLPEIARASPGTGRWSYYLGAGGSSSFYWVADGGWAHLRVQYSLGRRWYVATGLDYHSGIYRIREEEAGALDELQAALQENINNDPNTESTPGLLPPLPRELNRPRHSLGLPLLAGYRLHPRWSLEVGGQLSYVWSSESETEVEETASLQGPAFSQRALPDPLALRSWDPRLLVGMRWKLLPRLSVYASWQQGFVDLVPDDIYQSRSGTLRAGLEFKL